MVAEAAHVWAVEPQFSADRRDPRGAQLVAAKRESSGRSQQRHPTDTEDLDREERATEQRAERPQRCQWQEDNSSHFGGGARSLGLGRMGRARGEGHPGGYRQELGRKLAQRTAVRAAPGSGTLSDLSGEDLRLRSGIAGTSGVDRVQSGPASAAPRAQAEGEEERPEHSPI